MGETATAVEQERVIAALPEEFRELARHVLLGKFNERGRPVGFHHAPGGRCPPGRCIDEVLERFSDGSYRARVSFWHPERGWVRKADPHTMFPDDWSPERVIHIGMEAYHRRTEGWVRYWRCTATRPRVAGYRDKVQGVTTFFPIGRE